jgi:hypothetical protein
MTPDATRHWLNINRAPVLTLWAVVVAERLGFKRSEALTLGRAVAGLNAYSKGKSLGIFKPSKKGLSDRRKRMKDGEVFHVELLGRAVPVRREETGIHALKDSKPISPEGVERYLESKFADALNDTREAMQELADAFPPVELQRVAFELYEQFRPDIPSGKKGWGAKGRLSLDGIRQLAEKRT